MTTVALPDVAAPRRHKRRSPKWLAPVLFLFPGVAMFAFYVIAPIFESIWISFYDWDGLGAATFIGIGNSSSCSTTRPSTPP